MKNFKKCNQCAGSGVVLGAGMMQWECHNCEGRGKVEEAIDDIEYLEVKNSESYNKAIDQIKSLDSSISEEKAKELFDEELKKIEKDDKSKNIDKKN